MGNLKLVLLLLLAMCAGFGGGYYVKFNENKDFRLKNESLISELTSLKTQLSQLQAQIAISKEEKPEKKEEVAESTLEKDLKKWKDPTYKPVKHGW